MKKFLFPLFLLLVCSLYGMKPCKSVIIKHVEKNYFVGQIQIFDTISVSESLNIHFYSKQFDLFFGFPFEFVNKTHCNEIVEKWNNPDSIGKFMFNWKYSYSYDRHSRIVEFDYSGCFVCSQMPFKWKVFYDKKNRPIRMVEIELLPQLNSNRRQKTKSFMSEYKLTYDNKDNIVEIKLFRFGKISENYKVVRFVE